MSSLGIFNKETKTYQKVAGTAEAAVVDVAQHQEAILALQSAQSK